LLNMTREQDLYSSFAAQRVTPSGLWAPFFAAEAERRGMPLTALEEMLIAHVGTRYVKTGRGARSTIFGIDIQQDVDGHYEYEFVVGSGRFKSSTEDWKPITFSVVQGLTAQAGRPRTRPSQLYSKLHRCAWPSLGQTSRPR